MARDPTDKALSEWARTRLATDKYDQAETAIRQRISIERSRGSSATAHANLGKDAREHWPSQGCMASSARQMGS